MASEANYQTIDRPYDALLSRDSQDIADVSVKGGTSSQSSFGVGAGSKSSSGSINPEGVDSPQGDNSSNGSVERTTVTSEGSMDDLWINKFIRSKNWKPKSVGFYIDGESGYAEFSKVFISGEIEALSGEIGGFTIGETDLSATDGVNTTILSSGATAFSAGPTGFPSVMITQGGELIARAGEIAGWNIGTTTLSKGGVTLDSENQKITVGATLPIIIDGVAKNIRSSNYSSGITGSGFSLDENLLEVGNISARGLIRTAVFQKDVVNTVGGNLAVLDGDVLETDMTALDSSTLTIKGTTTFSLSDILRIKDGLDDEWMTVTSVANAPTYTVTRDMAGDYPGNMNPAWTKGATVVNYRQSGNGGVYMTASESNAPFLSIFDHQGSPWSSMNTRLRIGNLNGYLGYTTDLYGIAIGETEKYLKYDTYNGLSIQGNITIGTSNSIKGGQTDFATGDGFFLGYSGDYKFSIGNATNYLTWDGTYMRLRGSFDVGTGGVINNASYTVATLPVAPTNVGYNNPSGID